MFEKNIKNLHNL